MFVLVTRHEELPVPLGDIRRLRHWHPMVPAKVSSLSFDATFLVRLGRRAKLRFESPVRTECDEARCLLAPVSTQNLRSPLR